MVRQGAVILFVVACTFGCGGSTLAASAVDASSGPQRSDAGRASGAGGDASAAAGLDAGIERRCGGTSCSPAADLAPPASGQGYQIASPANAYVVQPGQEMVPNYCVTLPNTEAFNVGTIQSWMAENTAELVVYVAPSAPPGAGSAGACSPQGTFLSMDQVPGELVELKMPPSVGIPVPAGAQIVLTMHLTNTSSAPVNPQVKVNLLPAENAHYTAGTMISFNTQINVPPATASGPGMQTVSGTCTAQPGANFFLATTHTHEHATASDIDYVSDGMTTTIVHTTDWQNPSVALWNGPGFLTTGSGDSFTYRCSYTNTSSSALTVGETFGSDEECMAIAYYFPAGTASCD